MEDVKSVYPATARGTEISVSTISFDSRDVVEGGMFVAIEGTQVDGHKYIERAIQGGATVIVCQKMPDTLHKGVIYIHADNTPLALAQLAAAYYGHPSNKLCVIGITGTNGKSTIAHMLYHTLSRLGYKVGVLSTIDIKIGTDTIDATHTTPDALHIHKYLHQMVEAGCSYSVMEVSSHAVVQKRIASIDFNYAVFTNITHDHLDYHGTFEKYKVAKKAFFDTLPSHALSIINADDPNHSFMVADTLSEIKTYSLSTHKSDYSGEVERLELGHTRMKVNDKEIETKLTGLFNASNTLPVFAITDLEKIDANKIKKAMTTIDTIRGRLELVSNKNNIHTFIDYAHTPDALLNVLKTLSESKGKGKLICVFGCGGDRDRDKRPEMGKVASTHSDVVIITSDNPRNEEPQDIIDDVKMGVNENKKEIYTIVDRKQAIEHAYALAQPDDTILVAGKGHETYIEINGKRTHFHDAEEIINVVEKIEN